ncbi:MAG TPA: hypothetical protein VFA26_20095 [Gemmataceae bacterium]|nr:hypothetical protein [Gemmataceae bacterium]
MSASWSFSRGPRCSTRSVSGSAFSAGGSKYRTSVAPRTRMALLAR